MGKPLIHLFSSSSLGCSPPSPILSSRTTSNLVPSGQSDLATLRYTAPLIVLYRRF
jgi:hypothetical protein